MHIKVKAAGLTGSDTLFYNLIFIYIWKTLRLQMKTIPEQDGSVIARIQLHFLKPEPTRAEELDTKQDY